MPRVCDSSLPIDLHALIKCGLERAVAGRHWRWRITVLLVTLSMLFHFPAYNYLSDHLSGRENNPRWDAFMQQVDEPFTYHEQSPGSTMEKTTFRLTGPLLAKLFHLRVIGTYVMQFILGILLIFLGLGFCHERSGDRVLSTLFIGTVVFSYFGSAAFFDIWAQRDPFGYFFLFLALFRKNILLIFASTFLAAYCDERALIASSLVFLFHWVDNDRNTPQAAWALRFPPPQALAVVAAWIVYFGTRWALTEFTGLRTMTGRVGLTVLIDNLGLLPWGFWSALEGAWLLVPVFFFVLHRSYGNLMTLFFLLALAVVVLVAALVDDITRSMAFGAIILFPAFAVFSKQLERRSFQNLLLAAFAFAVICPQCFTFGSGSLFHVDALPIKVLKVALR